MKVDSAGHASNAGDEELWNEFVNEILEVRLPPQAVVKAGCDCNYGVLYGVSAVGAAAIADSHDDRGQRAGGTVVAGLGVALLSGTGSDIHRLASVREFHPDLEVPNLIHRPE